MNTKREVLTLKYRDNLPSYIKKIIADNNFDIRLTKQFIYQPESESFDNINAIEDISRDEEINYVKGLYHRYPRKVLIFPTERCLGSCRFCFRKNIINDDTQNLTLADFDAIEEYIITNEINEVIFSGGDPFAIDTAVLIEYINRIKAIKQVQLIRIHTRVLTYEPDLITKDFVNSIKEGTPVFMVFHINSHLELTPLAKEKARLLSNNGILCFAQTALLHEVNDTEDDLRKLFSELLFNKIKPYYLFHPDRVKGTGHFYIPLKKGIDLYNSIYNRISGLAMPIYLFNIPDGYGHCIVDLGCIIATEEENVYKINTWTGEHIEYIDIEQ